MSRADDEDEDECELDVEPAQDGLFARAMDDALGPPLNNHCDFGCGSA